MSNERFSRDQDARRNAARLSAIDEVVRRTGRGVYKRIDENRELLELLQARCPEFLDEHHWVVGWLRSHDDFFTELAKAAQIANPHENGAQDRGGWTFPRPWPEHRQSRPLPPQAYAALAAMKAQAAAAFADDCGAIDRTALKQAHNAMAENQPWTGRVAKALLTNTEGIGIDTADDAWLERYFAGEAGSTTHSR